MKWFRSWVCQGQQGDNFPWVFSLGADFLLWGREWRGWGWGRWGGGGSCGDCTGTEGAASPGSWLVVVSKTLSLSVWFMVSLLGLCHPVGTLLFFHQVSISLWTAHPPIPGDEKGYWGILLSAHFRLLSKLCIKFGPQPPWHISVSCNFKELWLFCVWCVLTLTQSTPGLVNDHELSWPPLYTGDSDGWAGSMGGSGWGLRQKVYLSQGW